MTETPIRFFISGIKTEQFAIIEKAYNEDAEVELATGFSFGCNKDEFEIVVFIKITFQQNENPFLILEAGCEFRLEEIAWNKISDAKEKIVTIPRFLARHAATITTGTARGILHAKTEQTVFNHFILPTINVEEMISEDIVLKDA